MLSLPRWLYSLVASSMLILSPALTPLHAAIAIALQALPPLSFSGFQAHMPMSEARALIISRGGTLSCKPTTDPRLRECTGAMPFPKVTPRFNVLISSVRDTAAVIVLTGNLSESDIQDWARAFTRELGTPNHKTDYRTSESWQWIRKGQMLRLIRHKADRKVEAAITLTDGPLLDALGPPPPQPSGPKKQRPD